MDGYVEIGTRLRTEDLEKGINEVLKKMQDLEKKASKGTVTAGEEAYYQRLANTMTDLIQKRGEALGLEKEQLKTIQEEVTSFAQLNDLTGSQFAQANVGAQNIENTLNSLITKLAEFQDISKSDINFAGSKERAEELKNEILAINEEIYKMSGTRLEIKGITDAKVKTKEVNNELNKTDFNLGKIIRKVGMWAFALFGVRGAYGLIRNAISTLSQYNEQMATDIEYISYLLATTLQPVIEWLIKLVYKLLGYVNYIAKAWFGVDLFANASTKAFQKQNKVMKGTTKEATKLQKTLAGFDEMNVLNDNGTVTSGKGGGGVVGGGGVGKTPSQDLTNLLELSKAKAPKWVQWIADRKWLGGWITFAIERKELAKDLDKINKEAPKQIQKSIDKEDDVYKLIYRQNVARNNGIDMLDWTNRWESKVAGTSKQRLQTIQNTVDAQDYSIKKELELWKQGKLNKDQQHEVTRDIWNAVEYLDLVHDEYKKVGKSTEEVDKLQQQYRDTLYQIDPAYKSIRDNAFSLEKLQKQLNGELKENKSQLTEISKIKIGNKEFSIKVKSDTAQAFSNIQSFVSNIKNKLGNAINNVFKNIGLGPIADKLASGFGKILGPVYGNTRETIDKLKYKFRGFFSAKGSIVNMPGRGVPVYAGERGQEGIIPLSDRAQMEMLGEMIGKYITINATLNTNLDGRTIARKVEQINNDNNFALNR